MHHARDGSAVCTSGNPNTRYEVQADKYARICSLRALALLDRAISDCLQSSFIAQTSPLAVEASAYPAVEAQAVLEYLVALVESCAALVVYHLHPLADDAVAHVRLFVVRVLHYCALHVGNTAPAASPTTCSM